MPIELTPEQEARAKKAWAERSFDPDEYSKNLLGPEIPPAIQVAIAEEELRAMDPSAARVERSEEDRDALAEKKAAADAAAEEFCFLDPADYADIEASTGRVLTPQQLLAKLQNECRLECWFSLANEAVIAKELNPRDVALAYRKIGSNPENLQNMDRWRDAIAEIRKEEAGRQPMYNYARFGLQVCRRPGVPEYVCWLPGAHLREYAIVKFDSHGVPEFHIPGWRDALIALIRKQLLTEETADKVFGAATGPRARRYLMILRGLRERPYRDEEGTAPAVVGSGQTTGADLDAAAEETETASRTAVLRCEECGWAYGAHRKTCSGYTGGS